MENENGNENPPNDEPTAVAETAETEVVDVAALGDKVKDLEEKNKQLFARAKQAEGFTFNEDSRRWEKKEKPTKETLVEATPEAKTGELSETQLDYLDLKGITDEDEIKVIQSVMKKTGLTVRQALGDEYVVSKLNELKAKKANQNATPSSKRASQAQSDRLDLAIAEYERTQKLPDNFDLRVKVIDAMAAKHSTSTPPWRK